MNTIRPEDYVVLRPVYEDGDRRKRMLAYEVDNPPTVVFPDGTVRTCPSRINLLPHSAENRDASRWITFRSPSGAEQHIKFSDRANGIVQWRTVDGLHDESWLAQGTSLGGNAHGCNERYFERWGTPEQQQHNPTMSGSKQIPYREGNTNPDEWPPNPHFGAWPLYQRITPTMIESATAPLEWDPNDVPGQYTDHGGGQDRPVLDWSRRHLFRIEPFAYGRRHLHRCTFWAWDRLGWDHTDPRVAPWLGYVVPTFHCRGRMFDRAYWFDLVGGVETPIPNWNPPADQPPPGSVLHRRFVATTRHAVESQNGVEIVTPSPFPGGYAAAIMRRTRDNFCVGAALKIHNDDARLTRLTEAHLIQNLSHQPNPGVYLDSNSIVEMPAKGTKGRKQGWVGVTFLWFTGAWEAVRPALSSAMRDGLLDLPAVPHTVTLEGVPPP